LKRGKRVEGGLNKNLKISSVGSKKVNDFELKRGKGVEGGLNKNLKISSVGSKKSK